MNAKPNPDPVLCPRCQFEVTGHAVSIHMVIYSDYAKETVNRYENYMLCNTCGERVRRSIANFVKPL